MKFSLPIAVCTLVVLLQEAKAPPPLGQVQDALQFGVLMCTCINFHMLYCFEEQ